MKMAKRKRQKISNTTLRSFPMGRSSTVDIVIPVHNRFDLLQRCVDAIPAAMGNIPYSLNIIDNNSFADEAKGFYKQFKETNLNRIVRVRPNKENTGFPHACNQGAALGTSTLIFFLNSDVVLDPGSVESMTNTLFNNEKVGIVGMKLVFPDDCADMGLNPTIRPARKIQHVGLFTNIRAEFSHVFSGWSEDHPRPNSLFGVHAVTGAALLVRRNLFNMAGRFWEGYGLGTYEDCDLCMSIHKMGYNVVVDTKARGVHYTGGTAEKFGIPYPLNQNQQLFLSRWKENLVYTEYTAW
jgi:GT2 family glycosyltransferase